MQTQLLYLIGVPGSGKSTLFAELTKDWQATPVEQPFAHVCYRNGGTMVAVQLGAVRENFSGTDALGMNVQPKAINFMHPEQYPYPGVPVIAEGDRLGNATFFQIMRKIGVEMTVILLDAPADVAAARRSGRGSNQNPVWLQGRITKVSRLESFVLPKWRLDAREPVAELANKLLHHPVLQKKVLRDG